MNKKKVYPFFVALLLLFLSAFPSSAVAFNDDGTAKSLYLMEASTGTVLYAREENLSLPPASVTKIMTILLVLEALDDGKIQIDDRVTVSEYASKMGGSQVYLKAGEEMSVEDLLKSVVIASANDAAVALAEFVYGSEDSFVVEMNRRAEQLGMKNTVFLNTNGLDDSDEGHVTSAADIALMTHEVLKHERIFKYSTIWMDTIRNGAFGLTNTNRLIRFYAGANGLKTGSTSKAGFCISATAKRGNMQLIAVVMASPSRDDRNRVAASLLDYGFANWALAEFEQKSAGVRPVIGGTRKTVSTTYGPYSVLVDKGTEDAITENIILPDTFSAPIHSGDVLGEVQYCIGDNMLGTVPIVAGESVPKISFEQILQHLLQAVLLFP